MCKKCMYQMLFVNGETMTDERYEKIRLLREQEELNISTAIRCVEEMGIDYLKAYLDVLKAKNALYKASEKLYSLEREAKINQ
ncbi:hypothetical protein [Actinobacillus porcinus]|uniref:hypothetical protein n=1 Tax=Actinobacillus porcinus TaxID=51048 RepID=UPI0023560EFE|nr:hypothetical protein [Actinobacillus porcinus]MCI5763138.1 hypothetical protein [Actinobacillus porcinus]MDY5421199.1 hypothetical protein [Actinobacillus porcinus]